MEGLVVNAATEWRTDEPPKDGTPILAVFLKFANYPVIAWHDGFCWCIESENQVKYPPDYYALINHPDGKEWET